jgi:hypothetical protein
MTGVYMYYVEAPDTIEVGDRISLFLAGTITGSKDWQSVLIDKLKRLELIIFNPRRKNFPMGDPTAAYAQIKWEHDHLRKSTIISFWFAKETMGPIVLYELGAWSMTNIPIVIGMDPESAPSGCRDPDKIGPSRH